MRVAVLACLVALSLPAHSEVRLQVQQTDPASPAKLRPGDAFHARVLYDTDRPIRIFGRPKDAGDAEGASHASPLYGPGAGEALVWFSLRAPGRVAAMRLSAVGDGGELKVVEVPLELEWRADAPARHPAAWVGTLQREQQARLRTAPPPDYGVGLTLVVGLMFASVPAYLVVQGFAFWRMRGRRTIAFWVPVVLMGGVYAFVLLGALAGSNIVPIWLIFTSPVALIYVIVLLIRDFRRREPAA